MRIFWLKLINVIMVIFLLLQYNHMVESRNYKEDIERLNVELEEAEYLMDASWEAVDNDSPYEDGKYRGEANGFGGSINVELTILKGKIDSIEILSAVKED